MKSAAPIAHATEIQNRNLARTQAPPKRNRNSNLDWLARSATRAPIGPSSFSSVRARVVRAFFPPLLPLSHGRKKQVAAAFVGWRAARVRSPGFFTPASVGSRVRSSVGAGGAVLWCSARRGGAPDVKPAGAVDRAVAPPCERIHTRARAPSLLVFRCVALCYREFDHR
ncbi:hypothetical protein MTO96_014833 [Rhipicephalus appendiculatus]